METESSPACSGQDASGTLPMNVFVLEGTEVPTAVTKEQALLRETKEHKVHERSFFCKRC